VTSKVLATSRRENLWRTGRRAATSVWCRGTITAGLLALVLFKVDWHAAVERLKVGEWQLFLVAIVVVELAFLVGAVRWFLLVKGAGIEMPFRGTLRAYMIGMFSNNFLPSGFGGDAIRAVIVGRSRSRLPAAITSVLVDRVTSVACLVLIGWVAAALAPSAIPGTLVTGFAVVTAIGVVATGIASLVLIGSVRGAERNPHRVRRSFGEARDTLDGYTRQPELLAWTIVLGVAFQLLTITASWLIAQSLGADVAFSLLAVAAPMVLLATVLPISIAGFGVREGSYVVLLGTAGVSHTDATLISLFTGISLAAASLVGGVALLTRSPDPGHVGTAKSEVMRHPQG
jgi:glycosyltransferase 2 family protein